MGIPGTPFSPRDSGDGLWDCTPGTPFSPHSHWEDISPGDSRDFTGLPAIPGTQGMSLVDIGIVVANLDMSGREGKKEGGREGEGEGGREGETKREGRGSGRSGRKVMERKGL